MEPIFEIVSPSVARSALMPLVLDGAVKSVLVLVLTALVVFCMRRASAAARHLVWFLAMVSLLLLPVLAIVLPRWHVLPHWMGVVRMFESGKTSQNSAVNLSLTTGPSPNVGSYEPALAIDHPRFVSEEPETSLLGASQSAMELESNAPSLPADRLMSQRRISPWQLASWAWLWGAFLALLPLALGTLSLWRLAFNSLKVTDFTWLELLQRLRASLRFKRAVELLQSRRRRMPMTWGILRPKLLLPQEAQDWSEERRRVVLLHELAHVKRWDYLTNLLTQIVCALYWFNPLVWLAAHRLVAERERACDDLVLSQGAKPADYAEQVLQIAAGLPVGRFAAYGAIAMARPSKLEGRLLAILDGQRNRAALARVTVLMMWAMLTLIVVPVAMMKTRSSEAASELKQRDERATVPPAEAAWGEAVEGFRARLRAEQTTWRLGETPTLLADFSNSGGWRFGSSTNDYLWQIEVDGVWYRPVLRNSVLLEIKSSQPWTNLQVLVNDRWFTAQPKELTTAGYGGGGAWVPPSTPPERLTLAPGKHTVRLAVFALPIVSGTTEPLRAISNPIGIEIIGSAVGGAAATLAPRKAFIVTGRVIDAQSRQPIEDFTVKEGWPGDPDYLYWSRETQGRSGTYGIELVKGGMFLKVQAPGYMPEIAWVIQANTYKPTLDFELRKNDDYTGTVIGMDGNPLDGAQVTFRFVHGRHETKPGGRRLVYHTCDSDYMGRSLIATTDAQGEFKLPPFPGVVSMIVLHEQGFAEIKRDHIAKGMATRLQPWEGNAGDTAANGFQVRLRADRTTWQPNETPMLRADLRRVGRERIQSSTNSHLWRLIVDGKWYDGDREGALLEVKPSGVWTNRPVILNTIWNALQSDELSTMMYGGRGPWNPPAWVSFAPLRLSLGRHTIRLAVFASTVGDGTAGTVCAVSDPVEIEIRDNPAVGAKADESATTQRRQAQEIRLAQTEAELARTSQLYRDKLVSQAEYDQAKHAIELLEAELEGDRGDIADLKLKHVLLELERVKKLHKEKLVSNQELREAEFKVALRKAEYQGDPAEVARIRLRQAVENLERIRMLHLHKLVSELELNQAKVNVELLKAEQKADPVEAARTRLHQATEEWDRISNLYLGKHPRYIEAKNAVETRRAELAALVAERERNRAKLKVDPEADPMEAARAKLQQALDEFDQVSRRYNMKHPKYIETKHAVETRRAELAALLAENEPKADQRADPGVRRSFVRLVVGPDSLTFEGQKTTWEELPALLDKVSNRPTAVLEFAVASDSLTIAQLNEAQARAGTLSRQFGFEYASYIGVQPLGSKGSPAEVKAGRR